MLLLLLPLFSLSMDAHARAAQKTEKWLDLWRVHKTILQMLNDRNYVVTDAELALNSKEFVEKCGIESKRTILDKTFAKKDDPTEKVSIKICLSSCLAWLF